MRDNLKTFIVLLLGGFATYFLLKVREARTAEKKPLEELPPKPEVEIKLPKLPDWEINLETGEVIYRTKAGEVRGNINEFLSKIPVLRHISFSAMPYKGVSVYSTP